MKREEHHKLKLLINVNISRLISCIICLHNDIKDIINLKYMHIYIMKIEYTWMFFGMIIILYSVWIIKTK